MTHRGEYVDNNWSSL